MTEIITISKIKCKHCGEIFLPKNNLVKICGKCKEFAKAKKVVVPTSFDPLIEPETEGLTEERKIQICRMLACFTPITKIQGYFRKEYNLQVVYQTIKFIENGKKWEPVISRLRHEWIDNIYSVPVANRRYRLEAYDEIYNEAMDKKKFGIAMHALEQAREETDEKKVGSTSYTLNYIATMTDEELHKKKAEIINRIKRMPKFKDEEPINVEVENVVDGDGNESNGSDGENLRSQES